MFFVAVMIGWISGDVCFIVTGGNIFVVAMIGWISGDFCFIVTGGNVFCCCYDWLDKMVMSVLLWLVVMFFVGYNMTGWISGDVGLLWLVVMGFFLLWLVG